jgi:oxygen-independent coproporphyrinogen-3 oxidase
MSAAGIPEDLLEKYGTNGPRYTSYPTAPHFKTDVDHEALAGAWEEADADLSLYMHVPFCQVRCLFCGCHVKVTSQRDRSLDYVDRLLHELDTAGGLVDLERPLRQMHFGGGTPNFLLPEQMERLLGGIRERTNASDDAEWAIECDPRTLDRSYVDMLLDLGINRFSLGVQDLQPEVMKAVARDQGKETVEGIVSAIRSRGPISVNLDLIYGLPLQTEESWARTISDIINIKPTRLAVFGYAHVPWKAKHQTALKQDELPGPELRAALSSLAREALVAAGYVAIGMDHFALPEDPLAEALADATLHRNFMGYTTRRGLDQLAIGTSAISKIGRSFSQDHVNLHTWQERVDAGHMPWERGLVLSDDDLLRGEIITELSCNGRLDLTKLEAAHDIEFGGAFTPELERLREMEGDGLLALSDGEVVLTETGRYLVRNVCMVFDAWLPKGEGSRVYSRTV